MNSISASDSSFATILFRQDAEDAESNGTHSADVAAFLAHMSEMSSSDQ